MSRKNTDSLISLAVLVVVFMLGFNMFVSIGRNVDKKEPTEQEEPIIDTEPLTMPEDIIDAENNYYLIDGLEYEFDDEFNIMVLTGASDYIKNQENIVLPERVLDYDYLKLGAECFKDCNKLKSVEISSSFCHFEASIFENCTNLETVKIPAELGTSNFMFKNCTSLKNVDFYGDSSDLSIIGSFSFENCVSLERLIVCDNYEVENNAFKGCTSLNYLELPKILQNNIEEYELEDRNYFEYMGIVNSSIVTFRA